jgi:hypothetical protein
MCSLSTIPRLMKSSHLITKCFTQYMTPLFKILWLAPYKYFTYGRVTTTFNIFCTMLLFSTMIET